MGSAQAFLISLLAAQAVSGFRVTFEVATRAPPIFSDGGKCELFYVVEESRRDSGNNISVTVDLWVP